MAANVAVEVDPVRIADLSNAIDRAVRETGVSADAAVLYAAVKVAASGRSAAKIRKRFHKIVENPTYIFAKQAASSARRKINAAERKGKNARLTDEERVHLRNYQKEAPFFIVKHSQKGLPDLLPTRDRKDFRRTITRRGLAKRVWNVLAGKLQSMREGGANAKGPHFRARKWKETLGEGAGNYAVRMINQLTYLEDAYPGITNTALENGATALFRDLDRRMERIAKKAGS